MKRRTHPFALALALLLLGLPPTGCRSAYYGAMEKFGYHKRDILVDRVEDARETQQEAKERFRDALEEFKAVLELPGGELQERYERLREEYEESSEKSREIRDSIHRIRTVAEDLFAEWERELAQYSDPTLAGSSRRQWEQTRALYTRLERSLQKVEDSLEPVLRRFHDYVLFLKHNLNAEAVASLKSRVVVLDERTRALIQRMEHAIREAEVFLSRWDNASPG